MKKVFIAMVLTLGFATFANAQATRTWVSGVGDDVNPCSRTAPCKTFAGAISKTASPGIINCLDPAGYGAVTITKSIEIDCHYTLGSVLHSGVQGIIINALTTDDVVLRGLALNGSGTTLGTNGINLIQARSLTMYDVSTGKISGSGLTVTNSSNNIRIYIQGSKFYNVGTNGILNNNSGGANTMVIDDSNMVGMPNCVDFAGANGTVTMVNSTLKNCTTAAFKVENGSSSGILESNTITSNGIGVQAGVGVSTPTIRMSRNTVVGNTTGISGSGTTKCFASNMVDGNTGGNLCTSGGNVQQ
jgi:hypothetical protein